MQFDLTYQELIAKLNAGDEAAFSYVYNKYYNAVFANICKLIKSQEQAKDILQEVFILLWNRRGKLTPAHEIGGWLFTTSYYKSLEYLRESIRYGVIQWKESFGEHLLEDCLEDIEINYTQRMAVLNSAIALLSPQKKAAFNLCRVQGLSYEDAATELGISVETIKGYLKEAVKFIRNYALAKDPAMPALALYCLLLFVQ